MRLYGLNALQPWPELYVQVIEDLMNHAAARGSRLGEVRDLGPTTIWRERPVPFTLIEGRGGSSKLARLEALTYLAGIEPTMIQAHDPYREEAGHYRGAYGPRLWRPLRVALRGLETEPDTRRAVAPIFNLDDLAASVIPWPTNVPCTVALTLWRQGPELRLHVQMRSCDAWLGLYYDLPVFGNLLEHLARCLTVEAGQLWLTATSLHLYAKHYRDAAKVRPEGREVSGPRLVPSADLYPRGAVACWEQVAELAVRELLAPVTQE